MLILFPSDYFDVKQVDSSYTNEYEAVCQIPEFKVILWGHDAFVSEGSFKLYPKDYYSGDGIYRGWMQAMAALWYKYDVAEGLT